eukprot:maker-scaffold_40-snap-gene-2.71-mRNA-1 protein AED:0.08 eAED:0.16 QI:0/0/0.5/1/1/1/2/91/385
MPWLEKDKVLFIHIPRCGGTSITKHHRVGNKAKKGKLFLTYVHYRYALLEKANFPLVSYENCIVLFEVLLGLCLYFFVPGLLVPYFLWANATMLFFTSTFIFTAPILMRCDLVRRAGSILTGYILFSWPASTEYLVGSNEKGFLWHLTAERCLRYGYVTREQLEEKSFTIVRNPYSRLVSMYGYNKRLGESFPHFVRSFYKKWKSTYSVNKKTDTRDIYCHVLPMSAYIYDKEGNQLVNTILKQEQLKKLMATEFKDSEVPEDVAKALTGIPHANKRVRKLPWQQFYDQETMDMCLEMYLEDFKQFNYDVKIQRRTDLVPKVQTEQEVLKQREPQVVKISTPLVSRRKSSCAGEETYETGSSDSINTGKPGQLLEPRNVETIIHA